MLTCSWIGVPNKMNGGWVILCNVAYLFAASLTKSRGSACCIMTEMQGDSWPIRGWLTPTFTSPLIYSLSNAQGMCISDVQKWRNAASCVHAKTPTKQKHNILNMTVLRLTKPNMKIFWNCPKLSILSYRTRWVHMCFAHVCGCTTLLSKDKRSGYLFLK